MINNAKEKLDLIKNTINDSKYYLDDYKPHKGIQKILSIWLITFFIANLLLFLMMQIALKCGLYGTETYYSVYRFTNIVLLLIPVFIYFLSLKKINITYKEKDFLKFFSIYILLISIIKLYPIFSYYINSDILVILYDTIPLDILVIFLAILQIYRYFKYKSFLWLNAIVIIYMVVFIVVKSIAFNTTEINLFIINMMSIIDYLNIFSVIPLVIFIGIILIIKTYDKSIY